MKLLLVTLIVTAAAAGVVLTLDAKQPGPCMPYAERCLNCKDCSACGHCHRDGGKCSVCFNK